MDQTCVAGGLAGNSVIKQDGEGVNHERGRYSKGIQAENPMSMFGSSVPSKTNDTARRQPCLACQTTCEQRQLVVVKIIDDKVDYLGDYGGIQR